MYYVPLEIGQQFSPPYLYEKAERAGRLSNDGIRNMDTGAKRIWHNSWRRVKHKYSVVGTKIFPKSVVQNQLPTTHPDCGVAVGQPGESITNNEMTRPWCMCNVTEHGIELNENHPVIQSLSEDERAILLAETIEYREAIGYIDYDWADPLSAEAQQWRTAMEYLVNSWLRGWLRQHSDWLWATIDDVLVSAGLPREALACLDDDDQVSIESLLASVAMFSLGNGTDVEQAIQDELVEWLQDWTESDEDNLAVLVEMAQSMCPSRAEDQLAILCDDWHREGF
jgi:hypothetical protein